MGRGLVLGDWQSGRGLPVGGRQMRELVREDSPVRQTDVGGGY